MKKRFFIGIFSIICAIGIAVGVTGSLSHKNQQVYAESQTFVMDEGASFRLMWTKEKCGIIFRGQISNDLLESGVQPQLLIVPKEYLDGIRNTPSYASAKAVLDTGDYIAALETANLPYKVVTPATVENGSNTYLLGGIKTIQQHNMNKPFFGLCFYEQAGVRTYADIPDGDENKISRSIVYLSSAIRAINADFVQNDAMATEMTDYFMTAGIKESIRRKTYNDNKTAIKAEGKKYENFDEFKYSNFDSSVINYSNAKNTEVNVSSVTSTVYDDYLDKFSVSVNANGREFAVGKYLDYYVYVTGYDSNYLKSNGNYATEFESIKAGDTNLTVALGKDTLSVPVTVAPYDISQATITTPTTQINYIEQIQALGGGALTEKYDGTDYTPIYTLNIPAGGKILTNKTEVLNSASGSWTYSNIPTSGNAAGAMANLSGTGNLTGTQSSSAFDIHQNVYEVIIEYYYGADGVTAAGVSMAGNPAGNTKIIQGVYNTAYESVASPAVEGHTADIAEVAGGTIAVGGATYKVTYNVNYYNVNVICQGQTVTHRVAYGSNYKVNTPKIDGYYTDTVSVGGTMGAGDVERTVTYTAVDTSTVVAMDSIAVPVTVVHYWRNDHTSTDNTPGAGNDDYEGTEISENECSATYYVMPTRQEQANLSHCVQGTDIYFETQIKVTANKTLNGENYSKLGITFESAADTNKTFMMYIDVSSGSDDIPGTYMGVGIMKSAAYSGEVNAQGQPKDYYSWIADRPNSTNFTTDFIKLAVSKVGAVFTFYVDDVRVGSTQTVNELAGACYFGIRGYNVSYVTTQSMYKINASSSFSTSSLTADIDYSTPSVHYWRNEHNTNNYASGDDYYEGTEISETEKSSDYVVVNSSSVGNLNTGMSGAVSATNFYYETYIKTNTSTYNEEKWSKLGIQIFSASNTNYANSSEIYKIMFFMEVTRGSTTAPGTHLETGMYKSTKFNGTADQYPSIGNRTSTTNSTTQYIKLAVYKMGSSFMFFVDDIKVGDTQIVPELAGACYFGVMGFNIGYTTQKSSYTLLDSNTNKDTTAIKFATMDEDTFYYEAKIKPTSRVDATDDYTKVGILITNPANTWQYFFYLDTGCARNTHKIGVVDIEMSAGAPYFYYWYRSGSMRIPNLNTWNTENVLSVYKTGNRFVFMVNGIPVLERNDITSFAGAGCQIGIKAFNVDAMVSNVKYTSNSSVLSQLCKERNILAEDISVDGDLSDWTDNEKSAYYEARGTDGSGRGFKTYAKLGNGGIYVAVEIKSKHYTKQTLSDYDTGSNTPTEQADSLREMWYKSFNVEFRIHGDYYGCDCPACADDEAYEVSYESLRDGVLNSREISRSINIVGVSHNVRNYCFKTEKVGDYYNTVVEFIVPYESLGLDRTAQEVKMLFAVRSGVDAQGQDEVVDGLGSDGWWTGAYHCHNTKDYPFIIRDRIYWL